MPIQTTYVRPEDDAANWFTRDGSEAVEGPAVITALFDGPWHLHTGEESWVVPLAQSGFNRLFIPEGSRLTGARFSLVSGYFLPKK